MNITPSKYNERIQQTIQYFKDAGISEELIKNRKLFI
jgi:hypothetical protein